MRAAFGGAPLRTTSEERGRISRGSGYRICEGRGTVDRGDLDCATFRERNGGTIAAHYADDGAQYGVKSAQFLLRARRPVILSVGLHRRVRLAGVLDQVPYLVRSRYLLPRKQERGARDAYDGATHGGVRTEYPGPPGNSTQCEHARHSSAIRPAHIGPILIP